MLPVERDSWYLAHPEGRELADFQGLFDQRHESNVHWSCMLQTCGIVAGNYKRQSAAGIRARQK